MELSLRPWQLEDAEALAAFFNNPLVHASIRDRPLPYTRDHAREFIQSILDAPTGTQYQRAIWAGGLLVGSIGVSRMENVARITGEIGYSLAEPYWNRGILTWAVGEFCPWVFAHSDLIRIEAGVFDFNLASSRVLEKNGFQLEGTMRKAVIKNGIVRDFRLYALLRPEQ